MTRATIIGLAGAAGSGKDTVAEYLYGCLDNKGHIVYNTSFAEPLRSIADSLGLNPFDRDKKEVFVTLRFEHFELALIDAVTQHLGEYAGADDLADLYATVVTELRDKDYLVTDRQDKLTISPRRFCQLAGTEGGRAVRPSFWNDVLLARVKRWCAVHPTIKPDYIVVSDVRFPNAADAVDYLLYVDRPGVDPVAQHASESYLAVLEGRSDYVIHNDSTLTDLLAQVQQLSEDF